MLRRPYWPRIAFAAKLAVSLSFFGGALYGLSRLEKALPSDSHWQYVVSPAQGLVFVASVYFIGLAPRVWAEQLG